MKDKLTKEFEEVFEQLFKFKRPLENVSAQVLKTAVTEYMRRKKEATLAKTTAPEER